MPPHESAARASTTRRINSRFGIVSPKLAAVAAGLLKSIPAGGGMVSVGITTALAPTVTVRLLTPALKAIGEPGDQSIVTPNESAPTVIPASGGGAGTGCISSEACCPAIKEIAPSPLGGSSNDRSSATQENWIGAAAAAIATPMRSFCGSAGLAPCAAFHATRLTASGPTLSNGTRQRSATVPLPATGEFTPASAAISDSMCDQPCALSSSTARCTAAIACAGLATSCTGSI